MCCTFVFFLCSKKYEIFSSRELIRNPLLFTFCKSFLRTNSLEIDTHSSVTSLPGAPNQHWHHDTGALFSHEESNRVFRITFKNVHINQCRILHLHCCITGLAPSSTNTTTTGCVAIIISDVCE